MDKYLQILKKYWGYDKFRSLQSEIIHSIGEGNDTLGLMPTGGGKSITFQVPTMAMEGLCLVITPLLALMKDQVDNLKKRKIKAVAVYSGMSKNEIVTALENCIYGDYKFLYIAPERLASEVFLSRLKLMNVCMIAVDESHCISQWGYDFRPSYLQIADIRQYLPEVPVLALTATATPEVVTDIQKQLRFTKENVFRKSFERKNLVYIVRNVEDKLAYLLKILHTEKGSGIVYVRDRKKTKEIAEFLNNNDIVAEHFHAGLTTETKDTRQNRWKNNETRIIVATNAFGMGIDKPDVRVVIHLDLPDSLEAYFQEAGRAGRDEKRAYAVLLYNKSDSTKMKKRLSDSFPKKEQVINAYDKLGTYFELAIGCGYENIYPFNLNDFCSKFKLPILQTYNGLKIMEKAGYIQLTDELDNPSRILFLTRRESLYEIKLNNPELDRLIQVLLRSYTGLFTEYAHINEDTLAARLHSSRQKVYEQLTALSHIGIISYIPAKKTPFIIYTRNRTEAKYISIPPEAYDERKERYENKITEMLSYATEENVCRNLSLLRYFGQKATTPCEQCDVCMKNKEQKIKQEEFETIKQQIETILKHKPQSLIEINRQIKKTEQKIISVIRFLLDNNFIEEKNDSKFYLKA